MAIPPFLAMTAAEIHENPILPENLCWMACHFSPYGLGLSNRPERLPTGSVLMLNDITPIHGHDPKMIAAQLAEWVETFRCKAVLLDFQRPGCGETAALASALVEELPCPVAVSEGYAAGLDCPVFLPPLPHHIPLADWLAPWKGREIWLELALDGEEIRLTDAGSVITPLPHVCGYGGHTDEILHCHYRVELSDTDARFMLWRTREDIQALLEEAEGLGVTVAVGLYQEFR